MLTAEILVTPLVIGLSHSIETDHVIAVGNLVSIRDRFLTEALRGASWGLGHTIAVFLSALVFTFIKGYMNSELSLSFELFVGVMMVIIGIIRLVSIGIKKETNQKQGKKILFFNVGMVHGLAGSGTIAALLAAQTASFTSQVVYLSLFGFGTIIGMACITALITNLKFINQKYLSVVAWLMAFSSLAYGLKIIVEEYSI